MWELSTWDKKNKKTVTTYKNIKHFEEALQHAMINEDVIAIGINKPKR